ncbi:MAG: IS1634 family transposase [Thermaerobacter sp.]|nr:IS1634 family transposase [Thermaerobacter sp.]
MFVRTKRVHQNGKVYEYLLLVETTRERGKVVQRTVLSLGRADQLDRSRIDAMVQGLSGLTQSALVLDPHSEAEGLQDCRVLGALPVLRRLWRDLGIEGVLRAANRKTQMPLSEATFALVAARLMAPQSKRATYRSWLRSIYAPEFEGLALHHFYQALDLLEEQKDVIEQALWNRTQQLFAPVLDLVLMDTTNTYFHGQTRGALAQYGKSKEKRYDRRLISVGLLVTRDGVPMGHEVFPGNLHDAKAFVALLSRLRSRFRIGRVVLCADRGMVSEEILRNLREEGIEYVVGARLTNTAEDAISYTGANWEGVEGLLIRVKPMGVDGETYVVCHNPKQEVHDWERRKEVLARLRSQLHKNPSGSSLLRNTSYRSFIRVQGQAITLDEAKIRRSARYDGKYVLRSNADLSHVDIARAYRQLFQVERAFRDLKGPLELRPIRHFVDRRIRGHVTVCFLAYALEMALRQALAGKGNVASEHDYHEVMADLARLGVGTLTSGDRTYAVRTPLQGRAFEAFAAIGLRPPSKVLQGPANDPKILRQGESVVPSTLF